MGAGTPDAVTQKSRTLIHSVDESHGSRYQLWAELIPCKHPSDHVELRFTSTWTGARDPNNDQTRARFLLSPDALQNLYHLLGSK